MRSRTVLHAAEIVIEGVAVAALIIGGLKLAEWARSTPDLPPAEPPNGELLRRLEIRLNTPLDKGRGDAYRLFECYEVNRAKPTTAVSDRVSPPRLAPRDVPPGGSLRAPGAGTGTGSGRPAGGPAEGGQREAGLGLGSPGDR